MQEEKMGYKINLSLSFSLQRPLSPLPLSISLTLTRKITPHMVLKSTHKGFKKG